MSGIRPRSRTVETRRAREIAVGHPDTRPAAGHQAASNAQTPIAAAARRPGSSRHRGPGCRPDSRSPPGSVGSSSCQRSGLVPPVSSPFAPRPGSSGASPSSRCTPAAIRPRSPRPALPTPTPGRRYGQHRLVTRGPDPAVDAAGGCGLDVATSRRRVMQRAAPPGSGGSAAHDHRADRRPGPRCAPITGPSSATVHSPSRGSAVRNCAATRRGPLGRGQMMHREVDRVGARPQPRSAAPAARAPCVDVRTFSSATIWPSTICSSGFTDSEVREQRRRRADPPAAAQVLQRVDVEQRPGAVHDVASPRSCTSAADRRRPRPLGRGQHREAQAPSRSSASRTDPHRRRSRSPARPAPPTPRCPTAPRTRCIDTTCVGAGVQQLAVHLRRTPPASAATSTPAPSPAARAPRRPGVTSTPSIAVRVAEVHPQRHDADAELRPAVGGQVGRRVGDDRDARLPWPQRVRRRS